MKISFVVPAFNEELLIAQCLRAIKAEIARTPVDAEIIVVDNASVDATNSIASSIPGVKVIYEAQKGLVPARRAGFMAATGELIANIDADTVVPPGWLATVFEQYARHKDMVALSGPYVYHDTTLRVRVMSHMFYRFSYCLHLLARYMKMGSMMQGGNFIVRRDAIDRI
ncbi:MAG TPA: glycosyltransferase family 2 protein, partial [Alphaproteobacteria bacterium]|nr:glycosyltransferase family 2 protein [Alphaproteobacteria bacterium]